MTKRKMPLNERSKKVGLTLSKLSILKKREKKYKPFGLAH